MCPPSAPCGDSSRSPRSRAPIPRRSTPPVISSTSSYRKRIAPPSSPTHRGRTTLRGRRPRTPPRRTTLRHPALRRRPQRVHTWTPTSWISLLPGLHPGSEPAEAFHSDADEQPLLARLAVGVLVHAKKSLGEFVDMRVRAGFCDGGRPMDKQVGLRVVPILYGDDDARVAAEIPSLLAALGGVEQHFVTFGVHPHHRRLRASVRGRRHDMPVGLVLQHFPR